MIKKYELDKIAIDVKSHQLLKQLLKENSHLEEIMRNARNETEALVGVKNWVLKEIQSSPQAMEYYKQNRGDRKTFESLQWKDYAAIRLLDYIDHAGLELNDRNLHGEIAVSNPIKLIWLAVTHGTGGAKPYFFEDMLYLFRQFSGKSKQKKPSTAQVINWMERYPSGLDPRIVKLREENQDRIINILIDKIDSGDIHDSKYSFAAELTREQKVNEVKTWWKDHKFHLRFAIRDPDLLNEMLGNSLDPDTLKLLFKAKKAGIPFFVNPYYLSLLHVRVPYFAIGADMAIRHYVLYSSQLVNEFGKIIAWEREDEVEPGKPNAAGWLLPSYNNIHRRYPEVAILIPDTVGRACGGLCSSCQRMYNFQKGILNFNLDKLKPTKNWNQKVAELMDYFQYDSQLRDILITGGDALMSTDKSLKELLDAVYNMAVRKREDNKKRKEGNKYAEMVRIRLGTRLPAYLPQRITSNLTEILKEFRLKAAKIGFRQFIIQTHIESSMEITPELKVAVNRLHKAGWLVTNQLVFTTAASRRGHTARLRQIMNEIGILSYYTFSVKGYMENNFSFATNARAMQEQMEEKRLGRVADKYHSALMTMSQEPENLARHLRALCKKAKVPFLATDRNVLNLPGVGKSLTYRVIGITRYGRRILEFDHDATRSHSPIINKLGKIIIIESKSISEYLRQLAELGEDPTEYEGVYGYSIGETESRMPIYEYPPYNFKITESLTNLELTDQ